MNEDQPIMWQLEQMFDFIHSYKKNYIWGTGHDQQMLAKYLDMCGTNLYDGYVCSVLSQLGTGTLICAVL